MSDDDEEPDMKYEVDEDGHTNQISTVCDVKEDPGTEVEDNRQVAPEEVYYYSYDYGMNQNYFEQVHYESLEEYHEYNYFNYYPDQVVSNNYYCKYNIFLSEE